MDTRGRNLAVAIVAAVVVAIVGALFLLIARWTAPSPEPEAPSPRAAQTPTVGETAPTPIADAPSGPPATVSGHARLGDGTPVAGVEVCVLQLAPRAKEPESFDEVARTCVPTGDDGRYAVTDLPPGRSPMVKATRAEHVVDLERQDTSPLAAGEARTVDMGVRPLSDFVKLEVFVEDEGGGPIPGARVGGARNEDDKRCPLGGVTAADGRVVVYCFPGEHRVYADAPGYVQGRRDGPAPGTLRILLRPGASISGFVSGGAPGVEYRVVARPTPGAAHYGQTTPDGAFTISGMAAGTYDVTARGQGWIGAARAPVAVGPTEAVQGVEIPLEPTVTLRATIRRERGDCEEPRISLKRRTPPRLSRFRVAETNAPVIVDDLLPGTYDVDASCGGGEADLKAELVMGREAMDVEYTVSADFQIVVRVVDEAGASVAGAAVSARGEGWDSGETGPDGVVRLRCTEGPCEIKARREGRGEVLRLVDLEAEPEAPIEVKLKRGHVVEGQVVDRARRPVAGAKVTLTDVYEISSDERTTDAEGRFVFTNVEWRVRVKATAQTEEGAVASEWVRLEMPHDAPTARVVLEVAPAEVRIAGRVVTVAGQAAPGARVALYAGTQLPTRSTTPMAGEVVSGPDGRFVFDGLAARGYVLHADHESEGIAVKSVEGGDVELVLSGFGAVSGTVVRADGRAVEDVVVRARHAQVWLSEERAFEGARFRVDRIPAGPNELVVFVGTQKGRARVDVPAGGEARGVVVRVE